MKRRYLVGVAVILSAFFAMPVPAEDSEVSRATLAGLQGVGVVVEEIQPNIQKYAAKFGLSGAQIRRDVVQKLQEGGIRVVEGNEWLAIPGRPVLCVNVDELVKSQKCPRIVIPVKTGIQKF